MSNNFKLPTISIVMPALNSDRTLDECLKSIRDQDYPQDKVEILLVDGGSTDNTPEIAKEYKCKFIEGRYRENQEARKGVGLHAAKNELVAYLDTDNILPHKGWLKQMIKPFLENPDLTASQTWRYAPREDFPVFSRYCALLGANDPVAYYLGKSEKLSWIEDEWAATNFVDKEDYILTDFTEDTLPTVGGNGFFVKRELLLKSNCTPEEFFHIDVVLDLVRMGYTKFAMVKNEIYHDTAASLGELIKRRVTYFKVHNPLYSNRRYLIFNPHKPHDLINLGVFILRTITLIDTVLFSLRGFIKKRDFAWFLHPLVCWVFLIAYGFSTIAVTMKDRLGKLRA